MLQAHHFAVSQNSRGFKNKCSRWFHTQFRVQYGYPQLALIQFQLHYLEHLLGRGPDDVPEIYRDRSPLYHSASIKTPLLVSSFKLTVG